MNATAKPRRRRREHRQETKLGRLLRRLRDEHQLSQREAARRLGVAHTTIRKIEEGDVSPSLGLLDKLARLYNLTTGELMLESERR